MSELIGKNVIIRTVTYHYVGRLAKVTDDGWITLEQASWVADSGRWSDALATGFKRGAEIEPFSDPVQIALPGVIDVTFWKHELPTEVQ